MPKLTWIPVRARALEIESVDSNDGNDLERA
jgi:hypothetical protein